MLWLVWFSALCFIDGLQIHPEVFSVNRKPYRERLRDIHPGGGMKIQSAIILAVMLATVPEISAQRGGGGGGRAAGAAAAGPRTQVAPRVPSTNIPAMTNPVAPIVPYRGNPSLGNSAAQRVNLPVRGRVDPVPPVVDDRRFDRGDRFDRRRDDIIVVGGAYYDPFYSGFYPYSYYPYMMPAPVPGQLPGVYAVPEPAAPLDPVDPAIYELPGAGAPVEVFEPRMIITPPEPDRVVTAPAIGTSRADLLSRFGQPWGTISTKGKETLYFRSLTVVLEEGKVSEVRE